MDPSKLIPVAEALPAPWWLLDFLGVLTLMLHLLVINIALGGSLISLFSRLKSADAPPEATLSGLFATKIPTSFAVGITLGVAPLLFFQVLYHHFFYTSSVLMAVFWILIIPLVIIGYYGAYINARKYGKSSMLATAALTVTCLVLLYVAFAFQNNISLMLQPEKWTAYFNNRSGTILSLDDPVLWPRYLHFITASVAVAALFSALIWSLRRRKGADGADGKIRSGLRIFAVATMIQIVLGFWLLIALPKPVMMQFMGQNMTYTLFLFLGIVLALSAIMTAVLGWLYPTLLVLLGTVAVMLLLRTFLRTAYLNPYFRLESLGLIPQYDVLAVFLVVFVAGLVILGFMLKWAVAAGNRKAAA
ncbi:MAG: hypothetical protein A3F83_12645 [Candidatus Glassbacteria bacterium RIFCSPLOWO2_12_FULL_58_11]|uniref:Uncharacterized protein n=2 Tax=Candidatus Glassiibacteriota TaxID=1817805 RepID=A0A1F5YWH0_9BACT|nr:MAG: hypothetical protein A2Z86_12250 [Candidatus Glassbacteria bacterium GWA2_58_10]OGG04528.1 MAG: hypothetical protein A3F83_12645 [Candidatus Glassbacteria bacterium RIFCSPLOWO2_12_FULL_58_11]